MVRILPLHIFTAFRIVPNPTGVSQEHHGPAQSMRIRRSCSFRGADFCGVAAGFSWALSGSTDLLNELLILLTSSLLLAGSFSLFGNTLSLCAIITFGYFYTPLCGYLIGRSSQFLSAPISGALISTHGCTFAIDSSILYA